MKYAVLGPQKGVLRVSDTEPQNTAPSATVVQITDEQAEAVAVARENKQLLFLIDGQLKTPQEKAAAEQAARKAEREAARLAQMTPEDFVSAAETHIAKYFSPLLLMDGLQRINEHQHAGTLETIPKTVAVAAWVNGVKQLALQGRLDFPEPPATKVEVLQE